MGYFIVHNYIDLISVRHDKGQKHDFEIGFWKNLECQMAFGFSSNEMEKGSELHKKLIEGMRIIGLAPDLSFTHIMSMIHHILRHGDNKVSCDTMPNGLVKGVFDPKNKPTNDTEKDSGY